MMNSFKMTLSLVVILWLITFLALDLVAQPLPGSARMAGMALSGDALQNGVDAIGVNPAQIESARGRTVSLAIAPFSMQIGTNFLDFATYTKYFTGVAGENGRLPYRLTDADKAALLNSFQGATGSISADLSFRVLAASVTTLAGSFAGSITDRVINNVTLPREYADFLLNGNTPGRTFDFGETRIASSWVREYGLSYAARIPLLPRRRLSLSLGATAKLVQGFGYISLDKFNTRFTTDPDSFVVSGHAGMHARYAGYQTGAHGSVVDPFGAPAGSGLGLDVGAQLRIGELACFGIAVTDIGAMQWTRNTREAMVDEDFRLSDVSTSTQTDEITDRMNGKEHAIPGFITDLPTAITLSSAVSIPRVFGIARPLSLAASMRAGLNESFGNSADPRFCVGMEWELISSVPLRGGVSYGGNRPAMYAFGLGFRMSSVTIDLATTHVESLFTSSFSTVSFAFGLRLDF